MPRMKIWLMATIVWPAKVSHHWVGPVENTFDRMHSKTSSSSQVEHVIIIGGQVTLLGHLRSPLRELIVILYTHLSKLTRPSSLLARWPSLLPRWSSWSYLEPASCAGARRTKEDAQSKALVFLSWCGDADGSNDDAANVEGHVVSLIRWYERGPSQRGESVAEMENVK